MFCRKCGNELPDNCVFCSFCGKEQTLAPAQPVPPTQPVPKKKKNLLWLWITLGVVGLAAIGGLVCFLLTGGEAGDKEDQRKITVWALSEIVSEDGSLVANFVYDSDGRVIEMSGIDLLTMILYHMEVPAKSVYHYDSAGNMTECVYYVNGLEKERDTYGRNYRGAVINSRDYYGANMIEESSLSVYDENGKLMEENVGSILLPEWQTYSWKEIEITWSQAEKLYKTFGSKTNYYFPDEFIAEMEEKNS